MVLENLYIYSHICQACWQEVYNFHKFYSKIEKAHISFNILRKTKDSKAFSSRRKSIDAEQNLKPQSEIALAEKTNPSTLLTKEIIPLEETSKRKTPFKKTTRRSSKGTCRKGINSTEIYHTDTAEDCEEICINFKEIENVADEIMDEENINDQNNSLESNNDPFSDGVELLEQLYFKTNNYNLKPQKKVVLVEKSIPLEPVNEEINSLEENSKHKDQLKSAARTNSTATCRKKNNFTELKKKEIAEDRAEIDIHFKEIMNAESSNDENNCFESRSEVLSDTLGFSEVTQSSLKQELGTVFSEKENRLKTVAKVLGKVNSFKKSCGTNIEKKHFTRSNAKKSQSHQSEKCYSDIKEENDCNDTMSDISFEDKDGISESDNYTSLSNGVNSPICDQALQEEDELISEYFQITCNFCELPQATFFIMIRHCKEEHNKRGYILCCNNKFYARSELVDHIKLHQNPDYFKCNYCNKILSRRTCLKSHIRNVHGDKGHKCDVCGKVLSNEQNLQTHKLLHEPDSEKLHCKECNKSYTSKLTLRTHINIVHLKKQPNICDICGKYLSNNAKFKRHMEQHEGRVKPTVSCEVCGRRLSDISCLKRHIRSHHPPQGVKLQLKCSNCTKIFTTSANLKKHIKVVHEKFYQRKCTVCDKLFLQSDALRDHMTRHIGKPSRVCDFCDKTFYSNGNMYAHRKKMHPKEWEESQKRNYSGNLPDK